MPNDRSDDDKICFLRAGHPGIVQAMGGNIPAASGPLAPHPISPPPPRHIFHLSERRTSVFRRCGGGALDHAHATGRSTDRDDHRSDARSMYGVWRQVPSNSGGRVRGQGPIGKEGRSVSQAGAYWLARAGILKLVGMLASFLRRPRLK